MGKLTIEFEDRIRYHVWRGYIERVYIVIPREKFNKYRDVLTEGRRVKVILVVEDES